MKKHHWSGRWPTDEYPANGVRIRFTSRNVVGEGVVVSCWCGIEPCLDVREDGGVIRSIVPTFDAYEVIPFPGAVDPSVQSEGTPSTRV